jgi:cbb3-type cytochrome oxidase subunit 3
MIQVILDEIEKPANANTKAEAINTDTARAGSSGNLRPSSTSPTSAAQPTYSEDDDIEAVLFLLFMFFLIIIAVVAFAIRHQRRLQRKEEKRKQKEQALANQRTIPEQIQFHYTEARRLEALIMAQQYPAAYVEPAYPARPASLGHPDQVVMGRPMYQNYPVPGTN